MYRVSERNIRKVENILREEPIDLDLEKFHIPNKILKDFVDDMKNDVEVVKKAVVLFSIMAKINACVYISTDEKITLSQKVINAMKETDPNVRIMKFNTAYVNLVELYTKYQRDCLFEELDIDYISLFPAADEMLNNTVNLISESALRSSNLNDYIYSPLKMAYYYVSMGVCALSDNHILDIIQSTLVLLDYSKIVYTTALLINKFITILCSNRSLMGKVSALLDLGVTLKVQYDKSKEKETKKVEQYRKKIEQQEQKERIQQERIERIERKVRGADKSIVRSKPRPEAGVTATSRWFIKKSLLDVRNNIVDDLKEVGLTERQAQWTTDLSLGGLVSSFNYQGILEYIKFKKYQVSKEMVQSLGKSSFSKEVLKSFGLGNVGRPPKEVVLGTKTLFMVPSAARLLGVGFVICKLHKEELEEYSKTITEPVKNLRENIREIIATRSFPKRKGPSSKRKSPSPKRKGSSKSKSPKKYFQTRGEWEKIYGEDEPYPYDEEE